MRIVTCDECSCSFTPSFEQKRKCQCGKSSAIIGADGIVYHSANSTVLNIPDSSTSKYIDMQAVASQMVKFKKALNEDDKLFCTKVIEYLNELAGTDYSTKFPSSHSDLILQRKQEHSLSLDDFFNVISKKVSQWKGTNFEIYLRPVTLFNRTKFANYLGENGKAVSKAKAGIDALRDSASEAKRNILNRGN